jgi:hypothetical protein
LDTLRYWTLLINASLRSACLQGLLEVGSARLLAAMLGVVSEHCDRQDDRYDDPKKKRKRK